jgi:uncharacterized protein YkwD
MRSRHLLCVLLVAAVPTLAGPEPADADPGRSLRRAVNQARAVAGLDPVIGSPALGEVAQAQAAEVAARAREERLGRSRSIDDLLEERGFTGFRRTWKRTDLARGFEGGAAAAAVERWRASPSAWRAALDPALTRLGVGTAESPDGWTVIVIVLAEPLERAPEVLARWERRILRDVNRIRDRHGLAPLSWRKNLAAVARAHSEVMASAGFMGHVDPQGRRVGDRLREAGLAYRRVGENVASNKGLAAPARVAVEGWMNSPGHRRQILDPGFELTGVGIAVGDAGTYYFTQVFVE